jgi:hypothetical protein
MGNVVPTSGDDVRWPAQASREFLLSEYGHVSQAFLSNEESGERRLNVLVGLIAAVTAAIGLAFEGRDRELRTLGFVAGASCAVLLVFGLATLRRIMERNLATDEYLEALRRIREFVAAQNRSVLEVLAFAPSRQPRAPRRVEVWHLHKAGLLEITAFTNCLLTAAGSSATVAALGASWWLWVGVAVGAAGTGWWLQMKWAIKVYALGTDERRSTRAEVLRSWDKAER